ncbi:aminoglycoside phosphotransferase [Streptomyces pluripotens]|uniref:Aminoglycoside phosphotransferase n=1 Tax=Streptomyces pluripotens TaxID=1355015 RepID=A0A221P6Z1_9ACTN|nr:MULTISPECIES: aminoglycoside phosphotransferase family protein [Streptomyces]ARP73655.1 aminoglycoside phosphotransferase [Streptomyces pluripotens]ASN27902.1 aminoglycoside phosphotransferase [Streptomyces pluripotens]KIE24383.1 aminoglycoside phosphotransferase [Streptomyces sp. MUSC 125]
MEFSTVLVRSLLRAQHPDLAGLELRPVPGGWVNQLWRLGEELAVRLPRAPGASSLLREEGRWLPVLAPRLPLPVPVPVRAGEPSACFPRPWAVVTWVPGRSADRAAFTRGEDAAARLAGFLRALHRNAPAEAPEHCGHGGILSRRAGDFQERLRDVADTLTGEDAADLRTVWGEAAAADRWSGARVWVHGDLHPANVVVADGSLAGVLDFGDVCAGDPATDLAAVWLLLPSAAAPCFFRSYGPVDAATMRRARGWAVLRGLSLMRLGRAFERGLPGGQPLWGQAGRTALNRVLTDWRA